LLADGNDRRLVGEDIIDWAATCDARKTAIIPAVAMPAAT
jgi:hypothetical protein